MEPQRDIKLEDVDLALPEFWMAPLEEREGAFLTLREQDPIHFTEESPRLPLPLPSS